MSVLGFLVDNLPLCMFASLALLLFSGLPVGAVLGGVALLFAGIGILLGELRSAQLALLTNRIFGGIIASPVLVAVPMFILMGTLLEKSGVAEDLLRGLQRVLWRLPGGLAVAVMVMGTILAASTGIIGASVVMLTMLALPVMLARGYDLRLASGTVAAAGTLGILIPPSIMLVIMGELLSISVGRLFIGALVPGLLLSGLYLIYLATLSAARPDLAPPPAYGDRPANVSELLTVLASSLAAPLALMVLVLGSILVGWATPTEASGVGAVGAGVLVLLRGRLTLRLVDRVTQTTVATTGMVFFIFVGATAFSYVFRILGGEAFILSLVGTADLGAWTVLGGLLVLIFVLGFFFDWIEITLIVLPIFAPVIAVLDFGTHVPPADRVYWFAVLVAVNLQTSFLTPPFGFALFYMKGAAPRGLDLRAIYQGVIPFVVLQLVMLGGLLAFPGVTLWLPRMVFD